MLRNQVITEWTELKAKIMTTIKELKVIKEQGFSQVYATNATLQKVPYSQLDETEQLKTQLVWKETDLSVDKKRYGEQLRIEAEKYTSLEKKLEQVRNLVADNQIEKLKRMLKKGEI